MGCPSTFDAKSVMALNLSYSWNYAFESKALSQTSASSGLDDIINEAFMPIAEAWEALIFTELSVGNIGIPVVLIILLSGATFFTCYLGGINIRRFAMSIRVVRGKYDDLEMTGPDLHLQPHQHDIPGTIKDESQFGAINHFQALTTAVSGTVGLGNIAMVAVAISIGGPGATFWMILAGLLGMSTKFVECTLGVRYREIDSNGKVFGGPMYYLSKGLNESGYSRLGKLLATVFALLCIGASLGGGNAFQSNQAAAQIVTRMGISGPAAGTMIGVIFALLVGIVILGGIKRIGQVTEKIVPLMALIYVSAALFIIGCHFDQLGAVCRLIIEEAFSPRASISGGTIGVMIQGFRRAAFSNEAGAGSASIAHSAVRTKYPASEGLVAMLEPFIDTVLICTMTAFVIIIFNQQEVFEYGNVLNDEVMIISTESRVGGVNLTSMAFDHALPGFSYVLAIAVVLFAFSTMLSWSYYGLQAWTYLFGRSLFMTNLYKSIFLIFTVLGAAVTLEAVIKFSDAMILALVFPNMIGLLFLFPKAKKELQSYLLLIKEKKQ